MGIKYFYDACGNEMQDNNGGQTAFGYPTADKRNVPFLTYHVICNECIRAFRKAINETVLKVKAELDNKKALNFKKNNESMTATTFLEKRCYHCQRFCLGKICPYLTVSVKINAGTNNYIASCTDFLDNFE